MNSTLLMDRYNVILRVLLQLDSSFNRVPADHRVQKGIFHTREVRDLFLLADWGISLDTLWFAESSH